MRAITLWQPWASLIAEGIKTIETRPKQHPWRSAIGETIAIHASRKPLREEIAFGGTLDACPADRPGHEHPNHPRGRPARLYVSAASWVELPLGAVVATCRLVDVVPTVDFRTEREDTRKRIEWIDDTLWLRVPSERPAQNITEQLPFGDFAPGRWALLLDDVRKLAHPVPCRGYQGLWTLPREIEVTAGLMVG